MQSNSKKTYEAIINLTEVLKEANGNTSVFQMNPTVYDDLEEYARRNKLSEEEMKRLDKINVRDENQKKVKSLIKKAKNPKKSEIYFKEVYDKK